MNMETLLTAAVEKDASDIYIIAGLAASFRKNKNIEHEFDRLLP